jgi:hypothetical protein
MKLRQEGILAVHDNLEQIHTSQTVTRARKEIGVKRVAQVSCGVFPTCEVSSANCDSIQ